MDTPAVTNGIMMFIDPSRGSLDKPRGCADTAACASGTIWFGEGVSSTFAVFGAVFS